MHMIKRCSDCKKEAAAIPFLDASFRSPVSVTWLSNGARAVSDRSPSVVRHPLRVSWVNGATREGARYPTKSNADSYRLTAARLT
jgi:hypothetical protein